MTKTLLTASWQGALSVAFTLGLAACAGEVEDQRSKHVPGDESTPPSGEGWVEDLAAGVEPCGTPELASCEGATRGACGVVTLADGESLCLPAFQWGVTPEGTVEFASATRVFTLHELDDEPLSAAERREAAELLEDLQGTGERLDDGALHEEGELAPLVVIDHSGYCRTSSPVCSSRTYSKYLYHYNSGGIHKHKVGVYANASNPYYYCNAKGSFYGEDTLNCGTPSATP